MNNIVLCGFMGCGKTTVGTKLAARCGLRFVDLDAYIEAQANRRIADIFATDGEAAFRAMEHEACVTLGAAQGLVIATGGGAVLRDDNVQALSENGTIVLLDVSEDTVLTRLAHDTTRPLLQREDKAAAVHELMCMRRPLYSRAAAVAVDANGDADAVADAVLTALQA